MVLLDFNSPVLLDRTVAGGKGANLARLSQADFPVPPGFVLSPEAYRIFMSHEAELAEILKTLPVDDPAALEQTCRALGRKMLQWPLPVGLLNELQKALRAFPADSAFSVRSSATAEDLGGAAFAGQHETYLNCVGINDIASRIRDCWISLWSARAVSYRLQAGIGVMDTAMAVVIQSMVVARVAGVGFCINPVDGATDEQAVDANYGLGESVVGGEYPVDHWILDKETGQIKHANIARKTKRIVAQATGVRAEAVSERLSETPCLSARELAELSSLMRRVERHYGYPQDVEWAIADGKQWLLQARPVTRIPARWTRDESAERFPAVVTPLAWDLVEEGFHQSLSHSFALMGLHPFEGKWFALFDNYVYGNQNAVDIYAEGTAHSLAVKSIPEFIAALPLLRERYGWVQELPLAWSRDLDRYLIGLGELMAEPLDNRSVAELWDYVGRVKQLGAVYFLPNIAISITQRTLYKLVYIILGHAIGREQAPSYFDRLFAYCETKTGFINKELYRLGRKISQRPALAQRLNTLGGREFLAAGGFRDEPELDAAFQKFLKDHGHREIDFDPYHPTWLEAPWLVVENLKVMLDAKGEDPVEKERSFKIAMMDAEQRLLVGLSEDLRFPIQELLRLTRAYTALDDIEHYQTTRLTLPFRRGLRALGVALQAKAILFEPMDIFFARAKDLDEAVRADNTERWDELRSAIYEQRQAYLRNRERFPSWELGVSEVAASASTGLSGLPGSPGRSSGPVFKVLSTEDFALFPTGAVLVARTTNPAWTPLFYKAAAVVTESGGPLSHGAVTAREVGLPAVMSVRGVLEQLENGQTVTVDGSAGLIML